MCGIAGHVGAPPAQTLGDVEAMCDAMAHRGPDGHGVIARGEAVLGHRRLSIVDLAGGAQPLCNEDGSIWIAYNGEVYNHAELRRDLEAKGHRFRTRSDTEAIVHAYEEHGPACVELLRGMFAFAIWDGPRRRLLLARDRLGIKPLYYARRGRELVFASELRALLRSPIVDRTLDEDALSCYLALRYVPGNATAIAAARRLGPGSVLVWEDGEVRSHRYWDVIRALESDAPPPSTEIEEAAHLRERVEHAVDLRLMSDVPIGAFLSGGLDSTLVTAAMQSARRERGETGPLHTFSVGYDDPPEASELEWAALAARALGTTHRERRVSAGEVLAQLPRILGDLDEPIADPAAVPLWFLAKRAREDVTVVLSGEGGDEAFSGYAVHRAMLRLEGLHRLGAGRLASAFAPLLPASRLRRAARLAERDLESRYRGVSRAFDDDGAAALLGPAAAAAAVRSVEAALEPIWEASRHLSPLRRLLYLDLRVWLPDDLLMKADKITMAASIELRVPLLDHHLVEYAFRLPDRYKLAGGEGKRILRRSARGWIPPEILARRKLGFSTPTPEWLRGSLAGLLREALFERGSFCRERFRVRHVEKLLKEHDAGADRSPELWALLSLEMWRRELGSLPVAGQQSRHSGLNVA